MTLWYAGAYTPDMDGSAEGILALSSRPDGTLEVLGLAAAAASPSFLALGADRLYAVAEATGRVVSFSRGSGYSLIPAEEASSGGSAPCHIGVYDETLVVSNYTDGALGVLGARPLELLQTLDGTGSGPHAVQNGPHAHSTFGLPGGTVLSADLGADVVHVHTLVGGVLERGTSLDLPPGTGPRDFLQHSSGFVYLLAELGLRVLVLQRRDDALTLVSSVDLPGGAQGDHAAGLSLRGDYLYAALRGGNLVSVLRIVDDGAGLEPVGFVPSGGDWPRHHAIDADMLHVANQLSSEVSSFRLGSDGMPELLGSTPVPSPTFLLDASRF
ncbi:hypothetical protein EYE40_05690 [Glaciihabitans arcticus]|uniref:Lactonase family protein n=1 Tax=Glaciihabitans arcticus TaxID=2668039 RepID=A0A4Q9GQH6_9MICO|nr:beta-propeller fold lactonase family protein [Glaciihabitans arcticus]TBN56931.1 hypothetical protein EYE40_05690 [Glaciihabitans arcticus]